MLAEYGHIGLLLIVAILFPASAIAASFALSYVRARPRKPDPNKVTTYECGMQPIGTSWVQFNFRYYFFALLFVLFDVEVVFLFPWAVRLKQLALFGLIEMLVFIFILVVGLVYAWKKKVLEWK